MYDLLVIKRQRRKARYDHDPDSSETERVRALLHRIHKSAGHPTNTNLAALVRDKGCPDWIIQEALDLKCDACRESKIGEQLKIPETLDTWVALWDMVGRGLRLKWCEGRAGTS